MRNDNWMHDTPGVLEQTLGTAILPQSHDCGSYAPNYGLVPDYDPTQNKIIQTLDDLGWLDFLGQFVSCFTKTQQGSILEQLISGARVLDFRVCSVGDRLHMHHGPILCEPLESAFIQVREFLDLSKQELIIIDAGHFDTATFPGGQPAVLEHLSTLAKNVFDDRLIEFPSNPTSTLTHISLDELTKGRSRVIVAVECSPDLIDSGAPIWAQKIYAGPYADTADTSDLMQKELQYVQQNSANPQCQLFQLQWILTPNEDLIIETIKSAAASQKSIPEILAYLNANGLKKLAANANAQLGAFLTHYKSLGLSNIRSLRLDYIEDTDAVGQCIGLMGQGDK